jgi:hypothetical protein
MNQTRPEHVRRGSRRRSSAWSTLLGLTMVAASLAAVPAGVAAQGLDRTQLLDAGWSCVEFLPANRWSCFNDGLGRPFPGNPDPRPSYTFLAFDRTSGEFISTGHLIRQDLYAGQPCAPGGEPYVLRAPIGYYECVR